VGIQFQGGSADALVEGNRVHHCRDGIWSWWNPSGSVSFRDTVIRGNHVWQNLAGGIGAKYKAQRVVIEDNLSEYQGLQHFGIAKESTDCTIRNNVGWYAGYYAETMTHPGPSGINIHTAGTGNLVDGNFVAYQVDVTGNDGGGIIVDLMDVRVTIVNNVSYRNMGGGLTITKSPHCLVANNTFVENGFGASEDKMYPGAGIRMAHTASSDTTIINNIFAWNVSAGIYSSTDALPLQRQIDHNLYALAPDTMLIRTGWGDNSGYSTLDDLQASTPWEDNGLVGDPGFTDAGSLDYSLTSQSVAIDQGSPDDAPAFDHIGAARDQAPDLGAFER
jgi:hypothetical protein